MDINEFYKGVLESLGLSVDEAGNVRMEQITGMEPFQVNDKNLILPTKEVLLNPNWNLNIAFHPLSENIARKDSKVFQALQKLAILSINVDIGVLMSTLVEYCADSDSHKNLNHKQTAFLKLFPDADATSLKYWEKIEARNGSDNLFAKLITLRDKKLDNQTYPRVTYVKFPFYEECLEQTKDKQKEYHLFGVKVRKKDVYGFKALFEFLLKHAANPDEHYSVGSRSTIAPSFHSLMSSVLKLKTELQKTYRLLKLDVPSLNWGNQIDNLSVYKGLIPPLDGNEGELTEGERRRNELTVQPTTTNQPAIQTALGVPVVSQTRQNQTLVQTQQPAPMQQPVVPQQQQAVKTVKVGNREIPVVSQSSALAQPQVNPYGQPMYPNPAMVNPTAYVQPMMGYPPMPAQPQMAMQPMVNQQPGYLPPQPAMPVDSTGRPIGAPAVSMPVQPQTQPQPYMAYGQPQMMGYNNGWVRPPVQPTQVMYPNTYQPTGYQPMSVYPGYR